ncbi:MAG: type II toxin-antitoxin system HicB family antitoxin [Methanothrix sp.]|nr:type II toxin-antitoxin system HicB family antitoxin [Methanothrix sp.]
MKYTVVLEPQDEGGFTVRCLELPGAITQGESRKEAIENIKEAIGLILEVLREDMESLNRTNAEVFQVELADVC